MPGACSAFTVDVLPCSVFNVTPPRTTRTCEQWTSSIPHGDRRLSRRYRMVGARCRTCAGRAIYPDLASGNSPSRAATIDSADAARHHSARDGTGDVRLPPLRRTDTESKLGAGHTAIGATSIVIQANNVGNLQPVSAMVHPWPPAIPCRGCKHRHQYCQAALMSASSCHVRVLNSRYVLLQICRCRIETAAVFH